MKEEVERYEEIEKIAKRYEVKKIYEKNGRIIVEYYNRGNST